MSQPIYCTISAGNYLGQVAALARSIDRCEPGASLVVLRFDAEADSEHGWPPMANVELIDGRHLGLSRLEYHRMAAGYELVELATAVKPWLLQRLLDRGARKVVYLDPDIQLHSPLRGVRDALDSAPIVLTPHILQPMPLDGRRVDEAALLHFGIFNLGFIGVTPDARPFLEWWQSRLHRGCVAHPEHGVFTDQGWVTLVPCLFDCEIVRDPTCNVAYWNLDQRTLTEKAGRFEVDGEPLQFFHFSGFDPDLPSVLSRHIGDAPHVRVIPGSALEKLCHAYAAELAVHVRDQGEYRWARTASGLQLTPAVRKTYLRSLRALDVGAPAPPDPFDAADEASFALWLHRQGFRRDGDLIRERWVVRREVGRLSRRALPEAVKRELRKLRPLVGRARAA